MRLYRGVLGEGELTLAAESVKLQMLGLMTGVSVSITQTGRGQWKGSLPFTLVGQHLRRPLDIPLPRIEPRRRRWIGFEIAQIRGANNDAAALV